MAVIHLDMDGVLADFEKSFFKRTGLGTADFVSTKDFWKKATEYQDLYLHLDVMHDARVLVEGVYKLIKGKDYIVEVLTATPVLATMPLAAAHKEQWIKKHFPHGWKFKIGPYSKDKQYHAKPGDILIDDKKRNIEQWIEAGGIGIHHTSALSSLKELKQIVKNAKR